MLSRISGLCVPLLLAAAGAAAQFVKPPPDSAFKIVKGYHNVTVKYKEVPTGICETRPNVKSYSGYAEVAPDQWTFFWFFESRKGNASDAELTTWINGGPGSSSMIGLFEELGPCRIDKDGKVQDNPYAWNEVSNMLFIDQPISTGFSYTKPAPGYLSQYDDLIGLPSLECPDYAKGSCGTYSSNNLSTTPTSTPEAAKLFWNALQGILGALPQYARHDFNFATESYGGHYGPVFNDYIQSQNAKNISGAHHINLKTVLVGNGIVDSAVQENAYFEYGIKNYFDITFWNSSIQAQTNNSLHGPGNCLAQIADCRRTGSNKLCQAASNFCASEVESQIDIPNRDYYDARELSPDPFPEQYWLKYVNTEKVQEAIGAYTNFTKSSSIVYTAFDSTGDLIREDGTIEALRRLVKDGIYTILYYGDADYICNIFGGYAVADEVAAPGYNASGYTNLTTSDNVLHGQVRQSGLFAFTRFFEAGHEVPYYQPLASLEFFERAITGKDIATGNQTVTTSYKTIGPKTSTYREGNATVQNSVVPEGTIYNTTTNAPNPYTPAGNGTADAATSLRKEMFRVPLQRKPQRWSRSPFKAGRRTPY